jgi:cystathionine beta-synthase
VEVLDTFLDAMGNTPLVRLRRVARDVPGTVLAKLEMLNPGGSVKDRIGLRMIEAAERQGTLKPGATIVEPTSGNTGHGLAIAAAIRGYRCIFVMPDKMSQEKVALLRAYGAEVVITPTAVAPESPESYYKVADRLTEEIPGAFQPNQYYNQENPKAHYETTGPEIWEQTEGKIDARAIDMFDAISIGVMHVVHRDEVRTVSNATKSIASTQLEPPAVCANFV